MCIRDRANLIAQADALAAGKDDPDPARAFSGNRPSTTLVMEDLSPACIGALLSFYEAKTVFEAFIWGINPFDQFGVELGKQTAAGLRRSIAAHNNEGAALPSDIPAINAFYLDMLFKGKIPG